MTALLYTIFIYPITQIIELTFTFSQKVFKDPGISILIISTVTSLLCLPLYNAAEKWQELERNTVKRLKPKIDRIKAVFSGDERFMILETFYRQNHYHPVYAMRSAFGLLLQVPFFIAAYSCISGLEVIKGASFLFIGNLGEPDKLLSLGNITVNVLPVLMTAINLASGVLYTKGFPLKDKIQLYGVAFLFLILLYNSPSAMVIYWTANNIFSLIKNMYLKINLKNKKMILAAVFTFCMIYLPVYLMFFYRGNTNLRRILSFTCIFLVFLIWAIIIIKHFRKDIFLQLFRNQLSRNNIQLFIFSFAGIWLLTGVFLPIRLIAASPLEFAFIDNYSTPLYFVANTCLQAASLFILWPSFIYFFLKKYQGYISLLGPILFFCALINIFVFPGNYGLISLELVFDHEPKYKFREIAKNLAVLSIPVLIIFLLNYFKRKKLITAAILVCISSVLCFSLLDFININREFSKVRIWRSSESEKAEKISPLFDLSTTGKNTVIIMLDRAISVFIPYIFEEYPELKEKYSEFVFYPNSVSFGGYTHTGAPPLFGGYEYTPLEMNRREEVPLITKHNEALLLMPRIFSEAGYKVTVTDPPYSNYSDAEDLEIYNTLKNVKAAITDAKYTDIWLKEHDLSFPTIGDILKRNILWYSIFKISPLAMRQGLYLQGDWCSPNLMQKMTITLNSYSVLDYMVQLTGITSENENTALIMVNNTTHGPSFLEAPDYHPVSTVTNYGSGPFSKETAYHVNAASIKRLSEWFDFLKSQNLYDNTRIILVSDHGPTPNFLIKTPLPFNVEQFNALLMVKDFEATGPLITDHTFMSNADVPSIAFKDQIENPVNPFTGKEISTDTKLNPLYIGTSAGIHLENPNDRKYNIYPSKDYYVHTNIFDPNNWKRADK